MQGWLILLLLLGAAAVAAVLWASLSGRTSVELKSREGGELRGESYELEQRILSIERKINDLAMLGKALADAAGGVEIRGIVDKQEKIRSYLIDYHEKYCSLLFRKHFIERAGYILGAELSAQARVEGVIELHKDMAAEYESLLEKSFSDTHEYLEAQKREIDALSDALLRDIVVAATNQIVASESPITERMNVRERSGEQLVADSKAGEEALNREYDRFLNEIELS
ncbi:MAG TPA: hypothetical protein VMV90_01655 [Rectinemataceae bacterium]|nr:hypothetical protein [Rectinemataceae bacterium]